MCADRTVRTAKDYVEGMWLMLQQESPEDFVLATGETHPVREFVEKAFAVLGYSIKWRGSGVAEEGYDEKSGRVLVKVDEKYFRPAEVECVHSSLIVLRSVVLW